MDDTATQTNPDQPESQLVTSQTEPSTRLDKILAFVPRALSSHVHIIFLGCLGVFLVLLPIVGVHVSSKAELIGGNYTNVTSDLGACIAAGLTVHLVKRDRVRNKELHELYQHLHGRHDELGKQMDTVIAAAARVEAAANIAGKIVGQ